MLKTRVERSPNKSVVKDTFHDNRTVRKRGGAQRSYAHLVLISLLALLPFGYLIYTQQWERPKPASFRLSTNSSKVQSFNTDKGLASDFETRSNENFKVHQSSLVEGFSEADVILRNQPDLDNVEVLTESSIVEQRTKALNLHDLNDFQTLPAHWDGSDMYCKFAAQLRLFASHCISEAHQFTVAVDITANDKSLPVSPTERQMYIAPSLFRVGVFLKRHGLSNLTSTAVANCTMTLHRGRGVCSMATPRPQTAIAIVAVPVDDSNRPIRLRGVCSAARPIRDCVRRKHMIVRKNVYSEFTPFSQRRWRRVNKRPAFHAGPNWDVHFANNVTHLDIRNQTVVYLPGTHVFLPPNLSIRLLDSSQLILIGHSNQPVIFAPQRRREGDVQQAWGSIEIGPGSSLIALHTMFLHGGAADAVIKSTGGHFSLLNTLIMNVDGNAIEANEARVFARDSIFHSVRHNVASVDSTRLDFLRCHFIKCASGIHVNNVYRMPAMFRKEMWSDSKKLSTRLHRSRIVASVFDEIGGSAVNLTGSASMEIRACIFDASTMSDAAVSARDESRLWLRDSVLLRARVGVAARDNSLTSIEGVGFRSCQSALSASASATVRIVRSVLECKGECVSCQHCDVLCSSLNGQSRHDVTAVEFDANEWYADIDGGQSYDDVFEHPGGSDSLEFAHQMHRHGSCISSQDIGSAFVDFDECTQSHWVDGNIFGHVLRSSDKRRRYPLGPRAPFLRQCGNMPWEHGTGTKSESWQLFQENHELEKAMKALLGVSPSGSGYLKPNAIIKTRGGEFEGVLHGASNRHLQSTMHSSILFGFESLLELLSYLSHPSIVRPLMACLNVTSDGDNVIAYVDGLVHNARAFNDASARVIRDNRTIDELHSVSLQLARAVAYLHESPIGTLRHADLKDVNILVRMAPQEAASLHVIDFDTVQPAANVHAPVRMPANVCHSRVCGSYHVAAECHRVNESDYHLTVITPQTDVYAMCQRLFSAASVLNVELRPTRVSIFEQFIFNNESLPVKQVPFDYLMDTQSVDAHLPTLSSILERCLNPWPNLRLTARQVADALERIVLPNPIPKLAYPPFPGSRSFAPSAENEQALIRWLSDGSMPKVRQSTTIGTRTLILDSVGVRLRQFELATGLSAIASVNSWREWTKEALRGKSTKSNVTKHTHSVLSDDVAHICGFRYNRTVIDKGTEVLQEMQWSTKHFGTRPEPRKVSHAIVKAYHSDNEHFDDESAAYEVLVANLDRLIGTMCTAPCVAADTLLTHVRNAFPHMTDVPSIQCVTSLNNRVFTSVQPVMSGVVSGVRVDNDTLRTFINWREYVLLHFLGRCARSTHNHHAIYVNESTNSFAYLLAIDNDRCFQRERVATNASLSLYRRQRQAQWEQWLLHALCDDSSEYSSFWTLVLRTLHDALPLGTTLQAMVGAEAQGWLLLNQLTPKEIFSELNDRFVNVQKQAETCLKKWNLE